MENVIEPVDRDITMNGVDGCMDEWMDGEEEVMINEHMCWIDIDNYDWNRS